jgi:hypothetical protein
MDCVWTGARDSSKNITVFAAIYHVCPHMKSDAAIGENGKATKGVRLQNPR